MWQGAKACWKMPEPSEFSFWTKGLHYIAVVISINCPVYWYKRPKPKKGVTTPEHLYLVGVLQIELNTSLTPRQTWCTLTPWTRIWLLSENKTFLQSFLVQCLYLLAQFRHFFHSLCQPLFFYRSAFWSLPISDYVSTNFNVVFFTIPCNLFHYWLTFPNFCCY